MAEVGSIKNDLNVWENLQTDASLFLLNVKKIIDKQHERIKYLEAKNLLLMRENHRLSSKVTESNAKDQKSEKGPFSNQNLASSKDSPIIVGKRKHSENSKKFSKDAFDAAINGNTERKPSINLDTNFVSSDLQFNHETNESNETGFYQDNGLGVTNDASCDLLGSGNDVLPASIDNDLVSPLPALDYNLDLTNQSGLDDFSMVSSSNMLQELQKDRQQQYSHQYFHQSDASNVLATPPNGGTLHNNSNSSSNVTQKKKRKTATPLSDSYCDMCGKSFGSKCAFKRHMNEIHMGVKPHQCRHCLKNFSRKDNMRKHEQICRMKNGTT